MRTRILIGLGTISILLACNSKKEKKSQVPSPVATPGAGGEPANSVSDAAALPVAIDANTKALEPNQDAAKPFAAESPIHLEEAEEVNGLEEACEDRLYEFWGPDNEENFDTRTRAQVRAMCVKSIAKSISVGPARFYTVELPLPGIYSDMAVLYRKSGTSYWLWESDAQERTTYEFEFVETTRNKDKQFDVFLSKGHYDKGETQERYTSLVVCDAQRPACKSIEVETEVSSLGDESGDEGTPAPASEYDDGYGFRKAYSVDGNILTISGVQHVLLPPN